MPSTPGPWLITPDGYRVFGCLPGYQNFAGDFVACTAHNKTERTETAKTNARLIAACPGLLEALKAATEVLECMAQTNMWAHDSPLLVQCRDAITKAEGGASK